MCVFSDRKDIDIPPKQRNTGMVFQNYALYPHMTVFENVAFGLKMRGAPKSEIATLVREALELVDLDGFEDRYPKQLSGGQQQRVAVARTVVKRPDVLLFDEPLSNLDPKLRVSLRAHLKRLHAKMEATSLYVTHDQSEAMVLADRIAVMDRGEIVQIGTSFEIYHFPETASVASFTGNPKTNLVIGDIHRAEERLIFIPEPDQYCFIGLEEDCRQFSGQQVMFHIRPEDISINRTPGPDDGRLQVMAVMPEGADTLVHLMFADNSTQLLVKGPASEFLDLRPGREVSVSFHRGNIYSPVTERLIGSFGYSEMPTPA
jgi:ABC-type sugar transport system ATPase subunit